VRHDADIADLVQVGKHVLLCHVSLTLSVAWLLSLSRPAAASHAGGSHQR
jgi:hypothetical protein